MMRPVLTLVSGTTFSYGLSYLARPALTRMYGPEAFGILSFFLALTALLGTISAARYEDALMLPKAHDDALNLLVLTSGLVLISTILSLAFAYWREPVAALFGKPETIPFLLLVPLGVLVNGGLRVTEAWWTRLQQFRRITTERIIQSLVRVPTQLAWGLLGQPGALGLITGALAGRGMAALYLSVATLRREGSAIRRVVRWNRVQRLARRYRRFPVYSVPSAFFNAGSIHLPVLLLFYFFDAEVVGFYGQSYGLLAVPISLIGGSVAQVFFVNAAKAVRTDALRPLTETVYRRLVMIGLFPMLALIPAGPDVFDVILGSDFREAGVYVQYLAVWLLFVFISSPLSHLFDVLEKQRENLMFNTVLFVTRIGSLVIGGVLNDARLAIALFGLSGAVLWLWHTVWMLRLGDVSLSEAMRTLLRYLLLATGPFILLLVVIAFGSASWMTAVAMVLLTGLYFLLVAGFDGWWRWA